MQINHRKRYGGGVMIQVNSRATLIKTFETPFEQTVCAQIKFRIVLLNFLSSIIGKEQKRLTLLILLINICKIFLLPLYHL